MSDRLSVPNVGAGAHDSPSGTVKQTVKYGTSRAPSPTNSDGISFDDILKECIREQKEKGKEHETR